MVVVRESPHAKLSPAKNTSQWPPKSPFQALLSSPSGRRKWQDRNNERERSVSPSPVKKSMGSERAADAMLLDSDEGGEEEEDEEMLQLKLRAIEAKLKLKKLQKAKREDGESRATSRAESIHRSPTRASKVTTVPPRAQQENIEVPLSPVKERGLPKEPVSPARRRLGISTAPKAQEVSLKRARDGTQIKRPEARQQEHAHRAGTTAPSFSERLNQSRAESQDQQVKQERIRQVRSKGFDSTGERPPNIKRPDMPRANNSFNTRTPPQPTQTREETSIDNSDIPLAPSNNEPESTPSFDPFSLTHLTKRHIPHPSVSRALEGKEIYTLPRLLKEVHAPHYDPPDCESDFVVFAVLASKSSPFDQKATHRTSESEKAQDDALAPRNKFMVLHLCDLKWEIDCFLFGTAFDQFWKLTPGTLLAVLNPSILPPKGNKDSGKFSLKLGSSEDCVMEIGVARDIAYCSSVKKDGQLCGAWIDKRKTEICEFHLNLEIERNRKHRMEVNSMFRGTLSHGGTKSRRADKKEQGTYHREFGRLYSIPSVGGGKIGAGPSAASLLDAEDMDALHNMSQEEVSRKRIAEAQKERDLAKRLGEMGRGVGAEYLRAKSTATVNGVRSTPTPGGASRRGDGSSIPYFEKPSAAELGLLGKKAEDQHLSPAKDRRRHFGTGAISSAGGPEAMGWGGARKVGLLEHPSKPGSLEKGGQARLRPGIVRGRSEEGGSLSPSKKRARFMLEEKGIREPGRESLGEELLLVKKGIGVGGGGNDCDEDDDDGLDIV